MLWDLSGEEAGKVYRCWNTAAKLAWNTPRNTFTYIVEKLLTSEMKSVRYNILTRYAMYMKTLKTNRSKEIRLLYGCVKGDVRSTTGINIEHLQRETKVDMNQCTKQQIRDRLSKTKVPQEHEWRVPLLSRLLEERRSNIQADLDNDQMTELIRIVCSSRFD